MTILDAAMPNEWAATLGELATVAGSPAREDVGDAIDRGLILRRLLEDQGFGLVRLTEPAADGAGTVQRTGDEVI